MAARSDAPTYWGIRRRSNPVTAACRVHTGASPGGELQIAAVTRAGKPGCSISPSARRSVAEEAAGSPASCHSVTVPRRRRTTSRSGCPGSRIASVYSTRPSSMAASRSTTTSPGPGARARFLGVARIRFRFVRPSGSTKILTTGRRTVSRAQS